MLVPLLLACLLALLTKWYFERRHKMTLLTRYGYNVPPTNFVTGNLHQV